MKGGTKNHRIRVEKYEGKAEETRLGLGLRQGRATREIKGRKFLSENSKTKLRKMRRHCVKEEREKIGKKEETSLHRPDFGTARAQKN